MLRGDVTDRQDRAARIVTSCPACGSSRQAPELRAEDTYSREVFEVVRCQACRLAYVNPRPAPEHLERYYPHDYYGARHPIFKDYLADLRVRALGPGPPGARLLDIGCGRGDFILACRRKGWRVNGVEQANSLVMRLRETLGIEVVTPEAIPTLPNGAFDFVTLWHVLEHLPEPRESLREVARLLKPGGRLLVEVPNFGSWQAHLGRAHWHHMDVPRHLLHFDRAALAALLARAGFTPERWHTFSLEYDTFGLAQTVLNRLCTNPNHLFRLLIGRPTGRSRRDTLVSFALLAPVGLVAAAISLVAPLAGRGGVLRVIARKEARA